MSNVDQQFAEQSRALAARWRTHEGTVLGSPVEEWALEADACAAGWQAVSESGNHEDYLPAYYSTFRAAGYAV